MTGSQQAKAKEDTAAIMRAKQAAAECQRFASHWSLLLKVSSCGSDALGQSAVPCGSEAVVRRNDPPAPTTAAVLRLGRGSRSLLCKQLTESIKHESDLANLAAILSPEHVTCADSSGWEQCLGLAPKPFEAVWTMLAGQVLVFCWCCS
ncbi:hypothetical protein MRB53_038595 [Persea americana]|nr:hypothetical protein MRB53_038595 [Persea americana]